MINAFKGIWCFWYAVIVSVYTYVFLHTGHFKLKCGILLYFLMIVLWTPQTHTAFTVKLSLLYRFCTHTMPPPRHLDHRASCSAPRVSQLAAVLSHASLRRRELVSLIPSTWLTVAEPETTALPCPISHFSSDLLVVPVYSQLFVLLLKVLKMKHVFKMYFSERTNMPPESAQRKSVPSKLRDTPP